LKVLFTNHTNKPVSPTSTANGPNPPLIQDVHAIASCIAYSSNTIRIGVSRNPEIYEVRIIPRKEDGEKSDLSLTSPYFRKGKTQIPARKINGITKIATGG